MRQEREGQPVSNAEDIQAEPSGELADLPPGRELFGEASAVSPSFYYCVQCTEDILAQDVVWDREGQPHCPECNSILERRSG